MPELSNSGASPGRFPPKLADHISLSLPDNWESMLPKATLFTDEQKMSYVIELAFWNIRQCSGGPFAAAVFDQNTNALVSIGVNQVVPQRCSIAHAEALAIGLAQRHLKTHNLATTGDGRYELFTSGQPCVQCYGMVWWSGITRLIIAARSSDIEQRAGFREGPLPENWQQQLEQRPGQPAVEVVLDVCRAEACEVLSQYAHQGGENYGPQANGVSETR